MLQAGLLLHLIEQRQRIRQQLVLQVRLDGLDLRRGASYDTEAAGIEIILGGTSRGKDPPRVAVEQDEGLASSIEDLEAIRHTAPRSLPGPLHVGKDQVAAPHRLVPFQALLVGEPSSRRGWLGSNINHQQQQDGQHSQEQNETAPGQTLRRTEAPPPDAIARLPHGPEEHDALGFEQIKQQV